MRIAQRLGLIERAVRLGLRLGHLAQSLVGSGVVKAFTRVLRLPQWHADMPYAASANLPRTERAGAAAIYFPSCISRVMGRLPGEPQDSSVMEVFVELAHLAGCPSTFLPTPPETAAARRSRPRVSTRRMRWR